MFFDFSTYRCVISPLLDEVLKFEFLGHMDTPGMKGLSAAFSLWRTASLNGFLLF